MYDISSEQERLAIIRDILQPQPSQNLKELVPLVIGAEDADDCAVYDLPGNLSLIIGTDFVRGTEFILFQEEYLNYFDIGYYLVIANLSDIAAMGATPIGLTTIIRYTNTLEDADFIQVVEGIKAAAAAHNTPIIGGDIGSYTEMVLAATALGIAAQGTYLRRSGTIEGDMLCVTGTVGLPSTAIAYFTKARKEGLFLSSEEEKILLDSWRRPVAHIAEGAMLARLGVVHACQDVSDGAKATIDQLGQASNLSFEIHESQLPIHPITIKVADFLHTDPVALAFSASVDFQLMFTVHQEDFAMVKQALEPLGHTLHALGRAIPVSEPSHVLKGDGSKVAIPGVAWNQQATDVTQVILTRD